MHCRHDLAIGEYEICSQILGGLQPTHNPIVDPPLARKYHSAPPSSAASERLFSTSKQVLKPKGLRLLPTNVEASVFLKKNLVAFQGSDEKAPDDFIEPNSLDCPESVMGNEDGAESDVSDIEISSDEEED